MSDPDDNIRTNQNGSLVVILAGGAGRRMGRIDKGEVVLADRRLVDHVVERLSAQAGTIIFSGAQSYGFGFPEVKDCKDGPKGPAAGLWAALGWVKKNQPDAIGFYTVPIDGPFLPADLLERLGERGDCAIACDETGDHPTFAYWDIKLLTKTLAHYSAGEGLALHRIATACHAKRISFPKDGALMNINTSSDLEYAENLIRSV